VRSALVHAARESVANCLLAARLTEPSRHGIGRLFVATFHRVLSDAERAEYPFPGLAVTPDELDRCLRFFAKHFHCGSLSDVAAKWTAGEATDRPFLAVTFDDGQRDNFRAARPVLSARDLRATFFVVLDHVESNQPIWHDRIGWAVRGAISRGRGNDLTRLLQEIGVKPPVTPRLTELSTALAEQAKRATDAARLRLIDRIENIGEIGERPEWDGLMGWDELAELAHEGHEIGSHTFTHTILPSCEDADLEREIIASRIALEERLGVAVASFCYPNGDWDERARAAVERAGYRWAVTCRSGPNHPGANPLLLRRFDLCAEHVAGRNGALSESVLAWRLSPFHRASAR